MHHTPFACLFKQDIRLLTDMGFVEGMELTVGYVQQLLATGMLGFRVDDVIDLECLCARPFRIAEYV